MKSRRCKRLSCLLAICMVVMLFPTVAFAAVPDAPTNVHFEVGEYYQTLPTMTWDIVEGVSHYESECDKNGSTAQSQGGNRNFFTLWLNDAGTYDNFRVTAINDDGTSDESRLEGGTAVISRESKTATAIHNTVTYDGVTYHLYTITGLPQNATCELDYKFYDPAKNGGVSYADNTAEEWDKKYTGGSQTYEINADGVLVIGMDEASETYICDDWSGLSDGVVNSDSDAYTLTVTESSSISADGKTVHMTQKKYTLSFAEYNGPSAVQTVSFPKSRIDDIEYGQPYSQMATNTGDGSLVYYSMAAATKKVNPTSGEIIGWDLYEDQDTAEVTAYAAATDSHPAAMAAYYVNFVEPSNAPTNIHLGFRDGNTNPFLKWTASGDTWTGLEVTYFDESGKHISNTTGEADSDDNDMFLQRASFKQKGAQEETCTFAKAEVTMTGTGASSATASQNLSFISTQTVSDTPLTAVYSGTSDEGSYGTCAHFMISGVPASKSMEVIYRYPTGTEYDGTMTTHTYHLSGSDESYAFFDPVFTEPDGVLSLSDLDIDEGDYYYLTVYDGTVTDDTTGSVNITIYPLQFVFDSRAAQDLSWSEGNDNLTATYGGTVTGKSAINSTSGGGLIAYASSDKSVATVDAASGAVTIKGAGSATITATAAATGTVADGYRETAISYTLTVGKKAISITADNAEKTFGEDNPVFTMVDPSGVLVSGDTADDLAVTLTTTATKTSNAGSYAITGTSTSANYAVTVIPGTLNIKKAGAPAVSNMTKSLLYSQANTDVAVNITGIPADRGTTSFTVGSVTDESGIIDGTVANTATGIQFSTKIGAENQTATIPVKVTMQNYSDATINVVVKLVGKTPVTITGMTVADKTYDGAVASYSGTPANEQGYTGTYEYVWSSVTTPKDAGSYTLTVKIPEDNADYMGEIEIPFTISRKALTVKPQNISIYNGANLPSSFALEYVGIASGDVITPSGTPEFALKNGDDTLANSSTNGTYTIKWTNKDTVNIEHPNYTITKEDGTLTIATKSSSGGGSSSRGNSSAISTPTVTDSPAVNGSIATTTVNAKTGANGTAAASVTQAQVSGAITAAQRAARSTGEEPRVEIKVAGGSNASAVETTMPQSAVQALVTGKMGALTLSSGVADMTFDAQAIAAIAGATSGDVAFVSSAVDNSTLSATARQTVGDHPVYNFSVTSGGNTISQFGGSVTVSVPYTPAAGENLNAIVAYYINSDGDLELMKDCHYDAKAGALVFNTTHFSTYAVGYNKVSFTDVSDAAWYADAVTFLAARGVTSGTTETTFSPNVTLTRGQFITLLMRAYGIAPDVDTTDNFSDAGDTYFTGYLAAAKRLGITDGIGDNNFAPKKVITRQEMFTLLYNTLKTIDQLPEDNSGKALSDFMDSGSVSSYAQEAMDYLVDTGIVSGNNGQLSPTDTSTRAQMAQVLYNLLEQ